MKNIYIIGDIKGEYRTQNLIKYLIDTQYNVYYNGLKKYQKENESHLFFKVKQYTSFIFSFMTSFLYRFYLIYISDVVILSALNSSKIIEVLLAKLFGKYVVVDFYVSDYDSKVFDRKMYKESSVFAKLIYLKEKFILKSANKAIFLTHTESKRYQSLLKLELDTSRISIIPVCVSKRHEARLKYYNIKKEKISICWWGTYIPLHGIEVIIDAANILAKSKLNFEIILFGNSREKSKEYLEMIEAKGLTNYVKIINEYTFNNGKLEKYLVDNCDMSLGNFGQSEKSKMCW
jgi:glycosyltransferase involved in cell wall biosynthesis